MPKEYYSIKKSLREAHPDWGEDKIDEMGARTFSDTFGITLSEADKMSASEWEKWKNKHGFGSESKSEKTVEVKTYMDDSGRYIEYVVASTGTDKAMGLTDDGRMWEGDNLTQECIHDMANQLKSAIGVIHDPDTIRDAQDIMRPDWTGTGHEHAFDSKHIVPISTTIKAEAFQDGDSNWKLKVVDKINEFTPRAEDFWNMVKSKVLNYASIEYKPIDYHFKEVGGKLQRFVKKLNLFGKTYTGRPANPLAGVLNMMTVKTDSEWYSEIKAKQEDVEVNKKMSEKKKAKANEKAEDEPIEPQEKGLTDVKTEELQKELEAKTVAFEELKKELEEVKAKEEDKKVLNQDEVKAYIASEFEKMEAERKNLVEEEQKKFEEVKSQIEQVKEKVKSEPTWDNAREAVKSMLDQGIPITHGGKVIGAI